MTTNKSKHRVRFFQIIIQLSDRALVIKCFFCQAQKMNFPSQALCFLNWTFYDMRMISDPLVLWCHQTPSARVHLLKLEINHLLKFLLPRGQRIPIKSKRILFKSNDSSTPEIMWRIYSNHLIILSHAQSCVNKN